MLKAFYSFKTKNFFKYLIKSKKILKNIRKIKFLVSKLALQLYYHQFFLKTKCITNYKDVKLSYNI